MSTPVTDKWVRNGNENEASVGSRAKRHAYMLRECGWRSKVQNSVYLCVYILSGAIACCCHWRADAAPSLCAHVLTSTACVMCFVCAVCNSPYVPLIPHGIFFLTLLLFSHLISVFLCLSLFFPQSSSIFVFISLITFHHVLRLCLTISLWFLVNCLVAN